MMGRSCFVQALLISVFLVLSSCHGFGRKLVRTTEKEDSVAPVEAEVNFGAREMVEVMDYKDPGPNTNTMSRLHISPPPQG